MEGWVTKPLGDVVVKTATIDPRKKPDESFFYVDVSSVSNKILEITEETELMGKEAPSRARRVINSGDVIFATVRPTLRRIAIVPEYLGGEVCSTGYFVFQTKPELYNRYLYYFLQTEAFMARMEKLQAGASYPAVNDTQIRTELISYPEITEQKRIVAILDEAFADIEQVRAKTEQNLKNARELFESYLQQVFSQRGEGWNIKQVSDIADTVLGKMLDKKKNKGTFKPYLRNLNVQWFDINTADLLDMRFEDSEYERYSIKKGDLVICEGGYPGRGAIWNNEEDIFFQKALHRVRSHKSIYNRWILYYLYLSDKNGELKKSFTGAGIQHFTGRALKALKIPVPTESMANKYIEKFDRIFNEVQLLENNYIRKLAGIDELKKSILQKAFSGELTKKTSLEVAHD